VCVVRCVPAQWWGTSTFSSLSGIPGPRPLPIVGNLHEMLGTSQNEAQGLLMRKYGGGTCPLPSFSFFP